jgi:hypothetical protein
MASLHPASKGCLMDILEQFFNKKYIHDRMLIQEQIPGENNPLFTLLYDTKLHHTTTWPGSCFFTNIADIWLPCNTLHTWDKGYPSNTTQYMLLQVTI